MADKEPDKARLGKIPNALAWKYEFQTKVHADRKKQPLALKVKEKTPSPSRTGR